MKTPELIREKVTLYYRGGMGAYHKAEASAYYIEIGPYAQYGQAVFCYLIPKGGRSVRSFVQTFQPSLVVLKGWNHFEPDSMMLPAEKHGDVETSRGRYSMCDPRWDSDFSARLETKALGCRMLHDFRGHNAMAPFIGPALPTPKERYEAEQAAQIDHQHIDATGLCVCGEDH